MTLSRDGITVAFFEGDSTIFDGLATGGYDVVSEMLGGCMAYGYTFVESRSPCCTQPQVSNHMTEDGLYGYSLDMAGDLAIVGAPSDTVNGVADAGQTINLPPRRHHVGAGAALQPRRDPDGWPRRGQPRPDERHLRNGRGHRRPGCSSVHRPRMPPMTMRAPFTPTP